MKTNYDLIMYDVKNFQRYDVHDLALDYLKLAERESDSPKQKIEIGIRRCLSYRKLKVYDMALDEINKAITLAKTTDKRLYGICLMNRGILFEVQKQLSTAVFMYREAIQVFQELYKEDCNERILLRNSIITLAALYDEQQAYEMAKNELLQAIKLFYDDEKNDEKYIAVLNSIDSYKDKIRDTDS